MINYVSTGNYLIVHYGSARPCVLEKGTEKYTTAMTLLSNGAPEEEIIKSLDIGTGIEKYSDGNFHVDADAGMVIIDGVEVANAITERIVAFYKENLPYLPLINFWRNVQKNPSEESKDHLFKFLDANKMPITHDGCFMAYKKVVRDAQGNMVDAYSGKFCNNVGAVVTMDRDKVDPNRDQTCSNGLHVAAHHYASDCYSGTDLLEVKVNPADVVAVPSDYNNEKMRVCRYEVVGINHTGEIKKPLIGKKEEKIKKVKGQKEVEVNQLFSQQVVKNIGDTIDLNGLTAPKIIELVKKLEGTDLGAGLKDLKNKKGIIKKATKALIEMGYLVA